MASSFFALSVLFAPTSSFADYIGAGGIVVRIHDDGTLAPPAYDSNFIPLAEEPANSIALTDDQHKVYGLPNTLGFANYILVWDANTGQRLPADFIALNGSIFPTGNNYIGTYLGHNQPLIRGSVLFALSPVYTGTFTETNNWQIKRFDINSHSLLEVINPPTTQHLDDIALNTSGSQLYVAGTSGIYRFSQGGFGPLDPTLLIPGVDGNIAYGADNRLYVRNFANGDVERYTTAGTFVDTFISHTSFPNLGTIQFGSDGNLHIYQGGATPKVLKFSSLNGSLLFTTPHSPGNNGRIFYVAPEPSAGILLCMAIISPFVQRHSRAGRRGI